MVNPDYATIGKNKKVRVAEWNRHCAVVASYIVSTSVNSRVSHGSFYPSS